MPRFELIEGTSAKFWSIERSGKTVVTAWGRIGTAGQSKTKEFSAEAAAEKEERQLVTEKTHKGYLRVGDAGASDRPAATKPRVKTAPTATKSAAVKPTKQAKA